MPFPTQVSPLVSISFRLRPHGVSWLRPSTTSARLGPHFQLPPWHVCLVPSTNTSHSPEGAWSWCCSGSAKIRPPSRRQHLALLQLSLSLLPALASCGVLLAADVAHPHCLSSVCPFCSAGTRSTSATWEPRTVPAHSRCSRKSLLTERKTE